MDPNANTLGIFTEPVRQIGCPHCGAELDVTEFSVFEDIICPSCQKEIKVPGRLGSFILLEELGRGAMGCVYLAQDEQLGRLVALKVMRREYGDDPKMMETLQKEAQAMATLNHKNVVSVYSFGRESGQPYFVMELLQGERLDAMMADGGIVNEVRLLEIALDVAGGLEAAGNAGMTHGDIKPANILMNDKGVAKVVDFGLARFMDPTAEIEIWGTPYYIAPEKARKKGEDSRSDQYSLGATMFHALAGHPPFDGENPTKVVLAALKEETPDLLVDNPDLCPKTVAVIRRMMDKTPARRYPTYASLTADLELALQEARAAAEARRLAELELQQAKNKKKNLLVPIMAGVAVFILGGIGLGVFLQKKAAEQKMEVKYPGPPRSLHEPLIRVEERNLREAAEALRTRRLDGLANNLLFASQNIPEIHAANAWHSFFLAGLLIYGQQPDAAREVLQAALKTDQMIFDGGKVPPEDPRILIRRALGENVDRELNRALRNAQPYFQHLLELAIGYDLMLKGRSNDGARHFRAYAEYRPAPGITWPYVLKSIAPTFHLQRESITFPTPTAEGPLPEPKAAVPNELEGLGIRDVQNRPLFRVQTLERSGLFSTRAQPRSPTWSPRESGHVLWFSDSEGLLASRGLEIRPLRRFMLAGILRFPQTAPAAPAEDIVFFSGKFVRSVAGAPTVNGLLVTWTGREFRVRLGDGEKDLFDMRTAPVPAVQTGSVHLISLSWEGWTPEGRASNRLSLAVDNSEVGGWVLQDRNFPPEAIEPRTLFGIAHAENGSSLTLGGSGISSIRAMVSDRLIDPASLFTEYEERIRNWSR